MPFLVSLKSWMHCLLHIYVYFFPQNRKSWTITKVEGDAGTPVADILVEGILPSWNFSELTVPERFLDYGTYVFTYRLQLLASKVIPLFRTASTYITVGKNQFHYCLLNLYLIV